MPIGTRYKLSEWDDSRLKLLKDRELMQLEWSAGMARFPNLGGWASEEARLEALEVWKKADEELSRRGLVWRYC